MDDLSTDAAVDALATSTADASRPVPGGHLVLDVADRSPFAIEWSDLDVSHVESFLAQTQEDEPLHWEAKGGKVTPDHIRHTVTAFANREGGYLIIGAERAPATGAWTLPGVTLPGTEPRTWLSNIIRTSVSPPPEFDIHAWALPDGTKVAVVRIQPNRGFLSMTGGRIYYRRPGESSYIENGAELQAIHDSVRYRSRALPGGGHSETPPAPEPRRQAGASLSMELDGDTAAAVVQQLVENGQASRVNIYLSAVQEALRAAVVGEDEARVEDALDRLATVAGVALSYEPSGQLVRRAVSELQKAFDAGLTLQRGGPNRYPADRLFAAVLARARAVGALGVRLQHWEPLRQLIIHDLDIEGPSIWSGWFRYGDVWASRGHVYRQDNNVLEGSRVPLRIAAQTAVRLPALRPDGMADEDALITSVCQFDFFINLVMTWHARDNDPRDAALPYFAAWDGDRVRPAATQVIFDADCRQALLPDVDDADLATLILYVAQQANGASQGLGSWGFWDGFVEGKVRSFLDAHAAHS